MLKEIHVQMNLQKSAKFLKIDGYDIAYTDAESHLRLDAIPQRDLIHVIEQKSTVRLG